MVQEGPLKIVLLEVPLILENYQSEYSRPLYDQLHHKNVKEHS